MTDLLDLLNELAGVTDHTHILMPNMAYACGGNIVTKGGHYAFNAYSKKVDCPDCKALDADEVDGAMRRMQGLEA